MAKKRVLNIVNKNALGGGVGTVIDQLTQGIGASEEFTVHNLFTTYDRKNFKPGDSELQRGKKLEVKPWDEKSLERLVDEYDVIHVHGIPHYGILETLQKAKKKGKVRIVNTAHSSVKQEFMAQLEAAKHGKDAQARADYEELRHFFEHDILNDPFKFADTYWGSAIYRQEQIMSLADSVQHMNEAYKLQILDEYKAHENEEKHTVIPNGVERVDKRRIPARAKKKRILYLGRFGKEKGIDEFTDSIPHILAKHPDAEIRIVGGDRQGIRVQEYREKVDRAIEEKFGKKADQYKRRVEFTGWDSDDPITPENEVHEHYKWADYVVVPSRSESFSLTTAEALMYGRIPIVTKTKAMDELYVSKGVAYGINEEERTGEGIAKVVNDALRKEGEENDRMAERGRAYVLKNFTVDQMILKQVEAYKKVLDQKHYKPAKASK